MKIEISESLLANYADLTIRQLMVEQEFHLHIGAEEYDFGFLDVAEKVLALIKENLPTYLNMEKLEKLL